MPESENNIWYKIWKTIFRVSLWYFAILIVGVLLEKWIDHLNDVLFPLSLLIIIVGPAFIISVFGLLIIRGKDRDTGQFRP